MWTAINGYKTYIGLALAAFALLGHKAGIPMPGVQVDDSQVAQNLWALAMVAFGRSALAKVATPDDLAAAVKQVSDAAAANTKK